MVSFLREQHLLSTTLPHYTISLTHLIILFPYIEAIIYAAGVHEYYNIHTALSDLYASYSLEFPTPSGIQIAA